jgi:hypothetical protein
MEQKHRTFTPLSSPRISSRKTTISIPSEAKKAQLEMILRLSKRQSTMKVSLLPKKKFKFKMATIRKFKSKKRLKIA